MSGEELRAAAQAMVRRYSEAPYELFDEEIGALRAALAAPSTEPALDDGPWQQLSDAATPGPWEAVAKQPFKTSAIRAAGRTVADMRYTNGHNDAALVIAAVNYIRARLAESQP